MLQTIGNLWVEYLTSVEALRTSIGLEAYAQRDPLVAYKSKATDMFQELLANIRAGVISRTMQMRPRVVQPATDGASQEAATQEAGSQAARQQAQAPRPSVLETLKTPARPPLPQINPNAGKSPTDDEAPAVEAEADASSDDKGGGRRRRRRR